MGPDNGMPAATTATAMAFAGTVAGPGAGMGQAGPYGVAAPQAFAMSESEYF